MKVTSKEIAKICGLSQGTVDRALNNRSGINHETKEKILAVAKEMGYRPHLLARSLASGKTHTIGIVVFDLKNRFFSQIINCIEAEARKAGYFVYLTLTNKDKEIERACIENLADRKVDGIILCSVSDDQRYEEYLKGLGIPIVTICNRISLNFPYIGIDDYAAMRDSAQLLINYKYKRIIYVSPVIASEGKQNIYAQKQRFLGFQSAFEGLEKTIEVIILKDKNYFSDLNNIDFKSDIKTAILCSSDITALDIMNFLDKKGIKIPDNLGLMGFDNIDILEYIKPGLSTVAYPYEELGLRTVETIIKIIEKSGSVEDSFLNYRIIHGDSLK